MKVPDIVVAMTGIDQRAAHDENSDKNAEGIL
jgi:hypothetical protein